jgi:hypothetical protein
MSLNLEHDPLFVTQYLPAVVSLGYLETYQV